MLVFFTMTTRRISRFCSAHFTENESNQRSREPKDGPTNETGDTLRPIDLPMTLLQYGRVAWAYEISWEEKDRESERERRGGCGHPHERSQAAYGPIACPEHVRPCRIVRPKQAALSWPDSWWALCTVVKQPPPPILVFVTVGVDGRKWAAPA